MKKLLFIFTIQLVVFIQFASLNANAEKKLSDLIPSAGNIPYLGKFITQNINNTDDYIEVTGIVNNNKNLIVRKYHNDDKSIEVKTMNSSIKLSDFISIDNKVLNNFTFQRFKYDKNKIIFNARINKKPITIIKDKKNKKFTIKASKISLSDVIEVHSKILDNITFEGFDLIYKKKDIDLTLNGTINNKELTVHENTRKKQFIVSISGEKSIYIKDIIVIGKKSIDNIINKNAFNRICFDKIIVNYGLDKKVELDGSINTKSIKITEDIKNKNLNMLSQSIAISDIFGIDSKVLDNVKLIGFDLDYKKHQEKLVLNGSINDKKITIKEDIGKKTFLATVNNQKNQILIKDIIVTGKESIDKIIGNNVFNRAGFVSFKVDTKKQRISLNGKMNNKDFSIMEDIKNKRFEVKASKIDIADVIGLKSKILDNFTFTRFDLDYEKDPKLVLNGTINNKIIGIGFNAKTEDFIAKVKPSQTANNGELFLKDIIVTGKESIDKIIGNSAFNRAGFDKFSVDMNAKTIILEGKLNNKDFKVTEDIKNKNFRIAASDIKIGDLIGVNNTLINVIGFSGFKLDYKKGAEEISILGVVDSTETNKAGNKIKKNVLLTLDLKKGVKDLELKLTTVKKKTTINIGDMIPEIANVPGVKEISFKDLTFYKKKNNIVLDGAIGTKAIHLTLDFQGVESQSSDSSKQSVYLTKGIFIRLTVEPLKNKEQSIDITDLLTDLKDIKILKDIAFHELNFSHTKKGTLISLISKIGSDNVEFNIDLAKVGKSVQDIVIDIDAVSKKNGINLSDLNNNLGKIPGINGLRFEDLSYDKDKETLEAKVMIEKEKFTFLYDFKQKFASFYIDGLVDASTFIPQLKGSIVNDMALNQTLFLYKGTDNKITITLPKDIKNSKPKNQFKQGFNIRSQVVFNGKLKKDLHLKSSYPLHGKIPLPFGHKKQNSKKNHTHKSKKKSMIMTSFAPPIPSIDIEIDIPNFSIPEVDFFKFNRGTLSISDQGKDIDLNFTGNANINTKTVSVSGGFETKNNKPQLYFTIHNNLTLSDINNRIKHGDKFALTDLKIYLPGGIEAQSEVLGINSKVYLFNIEEKDVFIFAADLSVDTTNEKTQQFSIGKFTDHASLSSEHNKTSKSNIQKKLNSMVVANAALILSSKKIDGLTPDSLHSSIGKDMFKDILGNSKAPINIGNITFLSSFDANLMGDIGKVLKNGVKGYTIGISEDMIINGEVDGIFDSNPLSLNLEFISGTEFSLDNLKRLKLPKVLAAKTDNLDSNIKAGIFLKIIDETASIGLTSGFGITLNNHSYNFTGDFGVQLAEDDIGLMVEAKADGKLKNAFGVPSFDLDEVILALTIGDNITMGMGATTEYLGRTMTVADNIELTDEGILDGFAFKTTISKLDKLGWALVDRTFIVAAPTLVGGATGAVGGGLLGGVAAGIVGDAIGDVIGGGIGALGAGVGAIPGIGVVGTIAGGASLIGGAATLGVAGDALGSGVGLAMGALAEKVISQDEIYKLADAESFIFKADAAYMSFATPGASSTELKIPDGIHFNIDNVTFFDKYSIGNIKPNISWIFKIAKALEKVENGIKKIAKEVNHLAKKAEEEIKKEERKVKRSTKAELEEAAKMIASNFKKLNSIIQYELGLTKNIPKFKYPRPTKKEVEEFKKALSFDVKGLEIAGVGLKEAKVELIPSFKIYGKAEFLGDSIDVKIGFTNKGSLYFNENVNYGIFGDVNTTAVFNLKNKDVLITSDFKENKKFIEHLEKEISVGITQLAKDAQNAFPTLQKAYIDAKKVSDALYKDVEKAKKAVKATKNKLKNLGLTLNSDLNKLKQIAKTNQNNYQHFKDKYKNTSCFWHPEKCADYKANEIYYYGLYETDESIYQSAKDAMSVANDLDKLVQDALVKFKPKAAITAIAKAAQDVVSDVEDTMNKKAKELVKQAEKSGSIFEIEEAIIIGSLSDIENNEPFVLDMLFKIQGKSYRRFFAFKPADPVFNAKSFAILPALAIDHLLEKEFKNSHPKVTKWIHSNIYKLLVKVNDKVLKELVGQEHKYKKILTSMEKASNLFKQGYIDLSEDVNKEYASYSMVDFMPESKIFKNRYLAIGHSSLCLSVSPNGIDVYQTDCKDVESERWTAKSLGNGYVQLKSKGLCLKARTKNNKSNGQALMLAQCDKNNKHEQWKIISEDGYWDKIVNKYSQKCLHFDKENANPKTANAIWTSCIGMASQMFRDIKDAERPTYHKVDDLIEAKNGSCLSTKNAFSDYIKKMDANKNLHINKSTKVNHYRDMIKKGDNELISVKCDKSNNDIFNFTEEVNGDMKLVHEYSGWCVTPSPKNEEHLILQPCNKKTEMFYRSIREPRSFELRNNKTNKCITLNDIEDGKKSSKAKLSSCLKQDNQNIDFVK